MREKVGFKMPLFRVKVTVSHDTSSYPSPCNVGHTISLKLSNIGQGEYFDGRPFWKHQFFWNGLDIYDALKGRGGCRIMNGESMSCW